MLVSSSASVTQNSANRFFAANQNFLPNGAGSISADLSRHAKQTFKNRLDKLIKLATYPDTPSTIVSINVDFAIIKANVGKDIRQKLDYDIWFLLNTLDKRAGSEVGWYDGVASDFLQRANESLERSLKVANDSNYPSPQAKAEQSAIDLKNASANLYWAAERIQKAMEVLGNYENQTKQYYTPEDGRMVQQTKALYQKLISATKKLNDDLCNSCVQAGVKLQ